MKTRVISTCVALLIGLALVMPSPALAAAKTHTMKGEVVSVDVQGKTLTVKDEKGETKTAPVLGKAVTSLNSLRAGEKVTLTCSDNEKGEHQGITAIKVARPAAKKK